jgi:hypothetical protein
VGHLIDDVSDQLNLRWAWEKVRREAVPGDIWYDELEFAKFELQLEENLNSIATEILKGRYKITPIRPMPFPKKNKEDGTPQIRQVFQIAIRDQVAWTAVVNIIGPHVDRIMPIWSYGNRLYRTIWIEKDKSGKKHRKFGHYRHASGKLYLPFRQSWPLFRRHVYLATRAMTKVDKLPEIDEQTLDESEIQERLTIEHKCPFVSKEYWQNRKQKFGNEELYWCSIDLEKFYPKMNFEIVLNNIVNNIPTDWQDDAFRLLKSMMTFPLNNEDWSEADLKKMDIQPNQRTYINIPTGLYVAGFLANAGMIHVDQQAAKKLANHNIAHFRFVDDHIIIGYRFDDIINWLNCYKTILEQSKIGTNINLEKVEPKELAQYLSTCENKLECEELISSTKMEAEKKCRLDPQFPSPLMTKTLALVSGIARTDFNLLEQGELEALTDQLEHLLLVDLPEDEIPTRTRLSFAAMRLTRIAECRLSRDSARVQSSCKQKLLKDKLSRDDLDKFGRSQVNLELKKLKKDINLQKKERDREVNRVFQLLRKVLRERPDRIRLWTRALLMCRLTGVRGLADLLRDIKRERKTNPLAAEYLQANILGLLGTQVIIASRIFRGKDIAEWRRQAAREFMEDICKTHIEQPSNNNTRWYLRMAWQHYSFGIYCAKLVLKQESNEKNSGQISFPERIVNMGKRSIQDENILGYNPVHWAWWAGRMTLRDLKSRADGLVKALGRSLKPSHESAAFWRFFPHDVPTLILEYMVLNETTARRPGMQSGWWYDALRDRADSISYLESIKSKREIARVHGCLTKEKKDTVSLYEWCEYIKTLHGEDTADPRTSEWTAIEITRQAAEILSKAPIFSKYINTARSSGGIQTWIHPANFRIPRSWLWDDRHEKELTWEKWEECVRGKNNDPSIIYVSKSERISDIRYTPLLNSQDLLFSSLNPTRGLGLLLYGLLKKSFELPSIWNGPGHSDVLIMLPRLLLSEMTCSSWTLGVLQSCLLSRSTENMILSTRQQKGPIDDDRLLDPYPLITAREVAVVLSVCQEVLKNCQLSTLRHRARQLTPINVRQLTDPNWSEVFKGRLE